MCMKLIHTIYTAKMKNDALKRRGGRRKRGQYDDPYSGRKTVQLIGDETGESPKQIQRYLKLTELIPDLLNKPNKEEATQTPTPEVEPERIEGVDGEIVWENRKESVPNAELKEMVETYKTRSPQKREAGSRESARQKLDSLAKETAAKLSPEGRKAKPKNRGPEH